MTETRTINKAAMSYFITAIVVLACHLYLLPPAEATPADEAKFFYEEASGPADEELSTDVKFIRHAYSTKLSITGHGLNAFEKQRELRNLIEKGLSGDIHALAMASVLPHVDPEFSEGIDVSPIEPWLIRHLGEAEGHWLLGVFYLHWLSGFPPVSHAPVYVNAPKHFRKSALAGNRKSMMFISEYSSKGDDFTPLPGQEIKNPMPDYIVKDEREKWYWVVRAAELGDSWANYFAGLQYAEERPERPIEEASRMTVYYWDRSARRGDSNTCAWLALLFEDGEENGLETALNVEQDCKKSMFYGMLRTRLRTQGEYITDRKVSSDGADAEFFAQKFLKGIPKINFAPCMTQSQYEAALKESKVAYDEFKARQAKEKAAQQALYDKARKALPELRAELEAVGVKVEEGQ
jgi:TPR repeat protein